MSTAPKIASYDAIFEYFLRKNLKFRQVETLGFEPFLPRMSPEMIFNEVSTSSSPKQGKQNRYGFVYRKAD